MSKRKMKSAADRCAELEQEIERLRADLDECYQDLLTETLRANTAEERNDRLQAVVDAMERGLRTIAGMAESEYIEAVALEALAALGGDDE